MDTIVALATARGRAAIAVMRISGPGTAASIKAMAGRLPKPRQATLCRLTDPRDGEAIDQALVLWFPGPASFTGEDSAEFHIHGGRSVAAGLLDALMAGCGARMAEPGEFAQRAFANGKLDLAAVEGLADLIDAETAMQRRQALRQLDGALGRQIEDWRQRLLHASAWAEATLDFSDEADVDSGALTSAMVSVGVLLADIEKMLSENSGRERLRDGFTVVIAGPPNAGKSTLMNVLAQREVAIVSPMPGTTRDVIEIHLDVDGWPVTLIDTAGIRDSSDPIENEGIARTRLRAEQADLLLWLMAYTAESSCESEPLPGAVPVLTKADLIIDSSPKHGEESVKISALTGVGMDDLLALIVGRAEATFGAGSGLITRRRHREALTDTVACLQRAIALFDKGRHDELVAEELRLALRSLGRITGRVDVEDVLGAIFSGFCIGK
ncbi:MAG: tRNA uridine-5-carboxymethylaminomethyl(34) synthesis GTPase MnmE [Beijerinckiaceae bacterium]